MSAGATSCWCLLRDVVRARHGRVETCWLYHTLAAHADAAYKLVLGHHPAYPINRFSGDYQRNLDAESRRDFWRVLVRHKVLAYVCSHIMAFDVQVHEGVLQITTAGVGTLPHMPEDVEYLHCVQAALIPVDCATRSWTRPGRYANG